MVDDRWDEDAPYEPSSEEGVRRPPGPVAIILAIGVVAALLFLGYATAARDVPLMASAAVVLGLVLLATAASSAVSTWRAGSDGRAGRAFLTAILGGIVGLLAFGCFAIAILLALVYRLQA